MRSTILFFIFFTTFSFLLFSCKKDELKDEVKFPITLRYKSYSREKIRMWTKNGEITDQLKINDFLGNSFANLFDGNFYQLKFRTLDSADVKFQSALEGIWTTKIIDTSHIEFKGDVHLFHGMVFGNQATLDRSFLIYKSNKYTKGIRVVQQPTVIPPIIYRADLGFIANGSRKGLTIPGYLYKLRLYTRAGIVSGHMFGDFNELFLNELEDRDTLIIQPTKNNWVQ